VIERGEAAFYGPKADFVVTDCIGREWQLGTVQLDYNLPSTERFGLEYIGADNHPHQPVMIHRAPLGSMERFIGVLIEHYAGAFPLWLAPVQVVMVPITDHHIAYAEKVADDLRAAGLRVEVDASSERMNKKIRNAQLQKIPYMLVVGDKELENGTVAVRTRDNEDRGAVSLTEFKAQAATLVTTKSMAL
jgi:threonyl-tRNA synthetase